MVLPVINIRDGSVADFIESWSKLYFDANDTLYSQNINKLDSTESLQLLFIWKNGTRLSGLKQKSFDKKIAAKLDIIKKWKENSHNISFKDIHNEFNNLTTIWLVFLAHIINPNKFPIYDQHVYRSYYFLVNGQIKEIPNESKKLKSYEEEYLPFYNKLMEYTSSRKQLDEALWSMGKFLKQTPKLLIS